MLPLVTSLPPIAPGERPGPGVVHLWCFFYDGVPLWSYEALISAAERERLAALTFARDRDRFLARRALVRTVLSGYSAVAPQDVQFGADPGGKPRAVGLDLELNLSSKSGLAICAVSRHRVGVDVERMEPQGDLEALARRHFSPPEVSALLAAAPGDRVEQFFRLWTLKESFLKARGVGLSEGLDRFSFDLGSDPIRVDLAAGTGDDSQDWSFASLRASAVHAIAVAAETGGSPLALSAARYVPLQGTLAFDRRSP